MNLASLYTGFLEASQLLSCQTTLFALQNT